MFPSLPSRTFGRLGPEAERKGIALLEILQKLLNPGVIPGTLRTVEAGVQLIALEEVCSLIAAPRSVVHDIEVPLWYIAVVAVHAAHVTAAFARFAFSNEGLDFRSDAASWTDHGRVSSIFWAEVHNSIKNPKGSICSHMLSGGVLRGGGAFPVETHLLRATRDWAHALSCRCGADLRVRFFLACIPRARIALHVLRKSIYKQIRVEVKLVKTLFHIPLYL
mmetsp:Transcript_53409/g.86469  ORF Transcript_53409/g.86469 Transcript_53409/m.86469 type:complete len:221 (+) Transcript_53409:4055-4717(+)